MILQAQLLLNGDFLEVRETPESHGVAVEDDLVGAAAAVI